MHTANYLSLVPAPLTTKVLPGSFSMEDSCKVVCEPSLIPRAEQFAKRLRGATGFPLAVTSDLAAVTCNDITLELSTSLAHLGPEGYLFDSGEGAPVRIQAPTEAGLVHGFETLLQLLPPAIYGRGPRVGISWNIPRVKIEDQPRFPWRGAMLDSARHFLPKSFVKKFIDLLAMHKLNVLHLHLTDDQGWRLEIKKYPRLTEVGSKRSETLRGHLELETGGDGIPHEGFYTQEDAREIVAYAAERNITVVPEIEMPGHAQAALAAYGELGCVDGALPVWTTWGINPNVFNPAESTIQFLQDVLEEVMAIFPSKYIHVGGDEVVKTQWEENAAVQARMRELGLESTAELQSWFIRQMSEFLTKHGRRLVGWDEIIEGDLSRDAIVTSWRGIEGGVKAAKAGHDVIMAPYTHTYFDSYQAEEIECEPLAIGGCITLEKVYAYDPIPEELSPAEAQRILGVQGQHWAEYAKEPRNVEFMAFPRLCALSEVAWSGAERRDFPAFQKRLSQHLRRLDIVGVNYRPIQPGNEP